MPSVSVLINCYNYGRYVAEAIESALSQSVPPDEIIVVDDGSTDETPKVLERYSGHSLVKVLRQRNEGQMGAFVAGMEAASGDLLFFLDADDKYEPSHIAKVTRVFAENKDVDFVFTAHRQFGALDKVVRYAPQDLKFGFTVIATLKARVYLGTVTSALAIRRNLSLTLLPVLRHIAPRWRIRADDCIVYGASLAGTRKYYLADPTALYRVHGGNEHFIGERSKPDEFFTHGLRRDTFFELLANHLGLGPSVRLRVVQEFLSNPQPTRNQYRLYVRLNQRFPDSFVAWLKGRIKIYLHYRRNRPAWDIASPAEFRG
jgi:glycosyltransferase involved in cell wall biosynthesis